MESVGKWQMGGKEPLQNRGWIAQTWAKPWRVSRMVRERLACAISLPFLIDSLALKMSLNRNICKLSIEMLMNLLRFCTVISVNRSMLCSTVDVQGQEKIVLRRFFNET